MARNAVSTHGIIYSATGEFWLGEAINSAKESRRFNDVPHLIFSDVSSTDRIEGVEFETYNSTGDPFLDKINSIERSPFQQTIYLDTDTYVIANLDEMFD